MSLKFLDSCLELPDKGGVPFLEYLSKTTTLYERSKAGGNLWYINHALLLMMEMHARGVSD